MRVEFRHGVPKECIDWLWDNVGSGNISPHFETLPTSDPNLLEHDWHLWKYERIAKPITPQAFDDDPFEYVPTITVNDDVLGTLFALRWS